MSLNPLTDRAAAVGKFYQVPCVLALKRAWCGAGWVPVLGPLHSDEGVVNFPPPHWHIDWRFAPTHMLTEASVFSRSPLGQPIQQSEWRGPHDVVDRAVGVQMRKMKCKRTPLEYPIQKAKWIPELNEEFKGCKAKNGICPHRGLPLVGHTENGITTCPGHGLRWHVDTGELVTA